MATNGTDGVALKLPGQDWTVPLWRNGEQIQTTNSFDLKASSASVDECNAAVDAAQKAFPAWSKTKPGHRRDLFLKAAEEMVRRKDELWHFANQEVASTDMYFAFDFNDALESLKSCAGLIAAASSQGFIPDILDENRSAMVVKEPYGVVVAIAPWNCPCILGLRSFLGPLAMGNTVVVKASERGPGSMWVLIDIFHKVGLPVGCLNTITHRPQDGPEIIGTLVAHPLVRKINFTGSTAVGSIVASLSGKNLKPTLMELGGKAPAIVCEDANLQTAAIQSVVGAFLYSGQICMATERIPVNAKVADQFRQVLGATIDQIFPDKNGLVLVDKAPVGRNANLLSDAISKGAKALYGDVNDKRELATAMRPVILEDVKKDADLYYQESFGPIVSLFIVENDEEAIKIANDTEYGLASAVFTENLQRGEFRIARQIETGAVHINSMSVHDETSLPHGGANKSGFGRFHGEEGLKEWVRLKTITWAN
ncbi:Putative aldehyde dehydrogenase domain, aldehyde/histidinol dehydrogenase [Septoria linicola]|uniref:Aldehyde dehydrogenase domain, aldehyde/histidinol dehydrogenase n=1 Tax=Septoria linicola TaxID=215465 RepID=A0A9Q9AZC9_9PEZI|nr:putative aldehyde dehydrogenase domain, aldehyde/histidinol dehydrogenase [Septoria linicola]USW56003.1 Putative aldehyde dehydrogenase domain, aldehyde/histidinol dehydrogenase [Septoria linicola]